MTTETIAAMPQPGAAAPDFTLPNEAGEPRQLADQRSRWVVLYFYPKDDTPGCTREACDLRDRDADLRAEGAVVWGVSILDSASKAAFKRKLGLPFELLADEDHSVAARYGVWVQKENYGKRYWGVQRATFLVDPDGRIARVWPKVRPDGHSQEILEALRVAKHAG